MHAIKILNTDSCRSLCRIIITVVFLYHFLLHLPEAIGFNVANHTYLKGLIVPETQNTTPACIVIGTYTCAFLIIFRILKNFGSTNLVFYCFRSSWNRSCVIFLLFQNNTKIKSI